MADMIVCCAEEVGKEMKTSPTRQKGKGAGEERKK